MVNTPPRGQTHLRTPAQFNVILGKNGSGKSHLLTSLDGTLRDSQSDYGEITYISPERGGSVLWAAHIDENMRSSPQWLANERRRNQSPTFRQQSAALFNRLELLEHRKRELAQMVPGYVPQTFDTTLASINALLERVRILRNEKGSPGFQFVLASTGQPCKADELSSGESEIVSLAIEILFFASTAAPDKQNFLMMDEPDVHLHPDLQYKLAKFIVSELTGKNIRLFLATHSTPLLAGLAHDTNCHIVFLRPDMRDLFFKPVSQVDRAILPVFGAHPLSNVFNESPILLVEGEDDERIWQSAVRSSNGTLRFYPCEVGGLSHFAQYENEVNNISSAVYDRPRAFSLRDRDDTPGELNDLGCIVRLRLCCRSAENLLLADETLALADTDWATVRSRLNKWITERPGHSRYAEMVAFKDGGFDRKGFTLKNIRYILLGEITTKPWEVLVGRAIAALPKTTGKAEPGSLRDFLGSRVCAHLLGMGLA
ncbi:MAG: AAA family ATPase [Nitrospira sp.]